MYDIVDVTTYDSAEPEFIKVYRNAPYSMTGTFPGYIPAPPEHFVAVEDTVPEYEETLWTLPWDIPAAPAPPRGFEKLPTAEMFS